MTILRISRFELLILVIISLISCSEIVDILTIFFHDQFLILITVRRGLFQIDQVLGVYVQALNIIFIILRPEVKVAFLLLGFRFLRGILLLLQCFHLSC